MVDVWISAIIVLVMKIETICVVVMGLFWAFVGFKVRQKLFQQLMVSF